ncbi:transglycosylase SLT domain-containing protein (plasmid) [Pseudoalteromonas xiamenensis]|uniref:transglycosylase SLT domain-containing protein n=1 Tax=Pseudoalteromonas xiamenensis TaxID=882626 RepID=UPI0027E55577|nr:transglycosylase SLT domain-containing protein [Pseudoalteromonas xiamenensis]WMN61576.1 transglycosylase SLT domain-containing protein [Pseudoalteromonas xiamenensis]
MVTRITFPSLFAVLLMSVPINAATGTTTSFDEFKLKQKAQYAQFKTDYLAKYEAFKAQLIDKWGVPEVSSKDTFVSYSADGNAKLVVDFEKDIIEISIINDEIKALNEQEIKALLTQSLNRSPNQLAELEFSLEAPKIEADKLVEDSTLSKIGIENLEQLHTIASTAQEIMPSQYQVNVIERTNKRIDNQLDEIANLESQKPLSDEQKQVKTSIIEDKKQLSIQREKLLIANTKTYQINRNRSRIERSAPFLTDIQENASEHGIDVNLVLAVTETESHFNPLAKSSIPAFGLMQIVPATAGADVNKFTLKKKGLPDAKTLYESEQNLFYGAAYLNLLTQRFLNGIENPTSRLYCTIAAYNTGIGNVSKAFNGGVNNRVKAIEQINRLSHQEVFDTLQKRTPTETQRYLQKVLASKDYFASNNRL